MMPRHNDQKVGELFGSYSYISLDYNLSKPNGLYATSVILLQSILEVCDIDFACFYLLAIL